jgi:predicted negative regulator of RcsB-dependent stress response
MKSIFDRRVQKDENTRGLLITYAASFMGLASEYRKQNRPLDAEEVMSLATGLELDKDRRMTILYHFSSFAQENGHFDRALAALDTIRALGFKQPEFALRRGAAYEGKGDLKQAEAAYLEAVATDPSRGDLVQALVRLYLDKLRDTAKGKAQIEQWLRRVPSDSQAVRQLRQLS